MPIIQIGHIIHVFCRAEKPFRNEKKKHLRQICSNWPSRECWSNGRCNYLKWYKWVPVISS
jgi:hypothetical protein